MSTYLQRASREPEKIADRSFMIRCYRDDVDRLAETEARVPRHTPVQEQSTLTPVVRLVTWNLNMMMGADGSSEIAASAVATVLQEINADVIVLQEAPVQGLDRLWSDHFIEPMRRVAELDKSLQGMGFTLLRSPADNPALLATRLPVAYTEEGPTLDPERVGSMNSGALWWEQRAARYAELGLPKSGAIGLYATHLHHKDVEETESGSLPGVRRREVARLLEHWRGRGAAAEDESLRLPTVILADFNQPRKCDHAPLHWPVITKGLAHPAVAQPAEDGVADFLCEAGFTCSYDATGAPNNFGEHGAPPFTHWTGTVIDFLYINGPPAAVVGNYVFYTGLSDHLPVVVDVRVDSR